MQEFNPNSPAFVFDPFLGYQFEVFEMSDILWTKLVDFDSYPHIPVSRLYLSEHKSKLTPMLDTHCSCFDWTALDLQSKIVIAS